jgi:hypothetical protein
VSDEEFDRTLLKVEKAIAFSEASARGWFSVTDLYTLGSQSDLLSKLYKQVVQQVASVSNKSASKNSTSSLDCSYFKCFCFMLKMFMFKTFF